MGGAPSALAGNDMEPDGKTDLVTALPDRDSIANLVNETLPPLESIASVTVTECTSQTLDFSIMTTLPDSTAPWYTWSFGDGSPDETTLLTTISHSFEEPGTYEVTVTAGDAGGVCLGRYAQPVNVSFALTADAGEPAFACIDDADPGADSFEFSLSALESVSLNGEPSYLWSADAGLVRAPWLASTQLNVPLDLAPDHDSGHTRTRGRRGLPGRRLDQRDIAPCPSPKRCSLSRGCVSRGGGQSQRRDWL